MWSWVFISLIALTEGGVGAQCSVLLPERVVTVTGSCAVIRCTIDPLLSNISPAAVWIKTASGPENPAASIIYDSESQLRQQVGYRGRAVLTGNIGEGQCSLLLRDIRQSDAGTYQFIVTFSSGGDPSDQHSEHSSVNLSVFDKPQISGFGTMIAGHTTRLTCSVSHNCPDGNLQVKWAFYNMSLPLPWDTRDGAEILDESSGCWTVSSVLTLTPSPAHHRAMLACSVLIDGSKSSDPKTLTLEVKYRPTILTGPTCTRSGNGTDCTCSSEANPTANMTWAINGRIITGNRSDGEVIAWPVNRYHVQSSLRLGHSITTGMVISCAAANGHGDSVSTYQLHSDGIHSRTILFIIGGGASGLVVLIAVLVAVKIRGMKREEAAGLSERLEDRMICRTLQDTVNPERNVHSHGGELMNPMQDEEIVYTAIKFANVNGRCSLRVNIN
ncbi:sialic acid-binding Ig-like lectin 8 [Carcharodon carcharias]|uniref:sialic acid-binding Ig-like lectin 8 n=1 Tax=Carcharodon carcharias TaxID=13397 RepID=UPI001B7EFF0F|nr:sialic acid-binding Ig-like lectin 8 [Carcharodon carcharias]XP_041032760.1 sialic acid-binding Ig-like lectin 8 [Carcharodon carcharias]XP_041032761.1 sialic acid-binding Ig-like lectin 8 [Carcharodon carcharias]